MEQLDGENILARRDGPDPLHRTFNFRKLWHRPRPKPLTGLPAPTQVARVASFPQSAVVGRTRTADQRSAAVRRTLLVVLALNLLVTVAKVVVGTRTGTLTVLGAALESGLDMLNNVVGVMLVTVAGRAPDEDHPYGHDKFETVGAVGIVVFLSISCFELMRQGIAALMTSRQPRGVTHGDLGIVAATLLVNAFVVWYERKRGRELGSTFLLADAAHTGSDILVTLLALASLALVHVNRPWIDAVLAITVALIIAWSGLEVLRQSIPVLVDKRAIDAARLRAVVLGVAGIRDVRNVRSRSTPSGQLFAEVTIAVAGTTSVDAAHGLADAVEAAIEREFGTSQVTVHVEPV
jgi:cation diffusion facilitator family transporter